MHGSEVKIASGFVYLYLNIAEQLAEGLLYSSSTFREIGLERWFIYYLPGRGTL